MRLIMTLTAMAFLGATAASAQLTEPAGLVKSRAECLANFNAADANNDGLLNRNEIVEARSVMPTTLGTRSVVGQTEFMNACRVIAGKSTP